MALTDPPSGLHTGAPADNSLGPTDAGTRLINQHFPRQWGDTLTLAIRSAQPVTSPAVRERVTSALTPFGRAEHVTAVGPPYQAPGLISADRHIAFATVQFGAKSEQDLHRRGQGADERRPRRLQPRCVVLPRRRPG